MENIGTAIFTILLYVGFFAVLWYFMVRPQRKRQQEMESFQNSVKVGDYIVTNGGIYGKVIDTKEEVVILEVGMDKTIKMPIDRKGIYALREPNFNNKKEKTK